MIQDVNLQGQPKTNLIFMDWDFHQGNDPEMTLAYDNFLECLRGDGFPCSALSTDQSYIIDIHNRTFWVNPSQQENEVRIRLVRSRKQCF